MASRLGVRNAVYAALVACGAAASLPALSLGLGEIEMQSFLNEPLSAEVELLDTRQLTIDDIRIRLAGGDDFDRMGVDRSFFLTSIQFEVRVDEANGRGVILLSTDEAVLEPYLDLIIEARWPDGRLLREYTVLVDPPAYKQELITVSASERVEAMRPDKPAVAESSGAGASERSAGESSGRGDRVAMRESSLGPGEMPERAFSAATVDYPAAGNRYMVRRDETLWQIAQQGRPQGTSVQQAMLDIQRLNPEAFIAGNINRIKAGFIIYLPAEGDISSDDLARALEEVRDQNQEWQAARTAPGVTAAATLRVSADSDRSTSSSGDNGVAATMGASRGGAQDLLDEIVPADSESRVADDIATASGATSELAERLDRVLQRMDTLEQIVSLKDEQIATLEQALREAREAREAASEAVAVAPAAAVSQPTTQPQTTQPQTTQPQTTPAATPRPAPSAAAGGSSSSVPWLAIGGGVLVFAMGIFVFLRRRASPDESETTAVVAAGVDNNADDVFAGVSLKTEPLADPLEVTDPAALDAQSVPDAKEGLAEPELETDTPTGDEPIVKGSDRGGSRGYGERKHDDYIDDAASGDALAEADIYIAYGRYLQAIELLDSAIEKDPSNTAYRVKLIELYVDMGEADSAAAQVAALREYGDEDAIARGEALLGASGDDTNDVLAAPAVSLMSGSVAQTISQTMSEEMPTVVSLDGDSAAAAEDELTLDLEDIPDGDLDASADILELDLTATETLQTQAEPENIDLDKEQEMALGEIQFNDLEIEEDEIEVAEDSGFAEHIGFAGDEEELDLSDALSEAASDTVEDTTLDVVEPIAEDDFMIADDADQMATKLDLARAYMDMGDSSGARSILEEVAAGGSAEQQEEARDLLSRGV
ncbi:MAG: FimV/HubP family polar landmark protein [Congregibacter sp.]